MTFKIYKLCNTVNDKIYVGRSNVSLEERLDQHKYTAELGRSNQKMFQLMRDFGFDSFSVVQLEEFEPCDSYSFKLKQQHWIDKLKPELNTGLDHRQKKLPKEKQSGNIHHSCSCGGRYIGKHKQSHFRTKKHKKHFASP